MEQYASIQQLKKKESGAEERKNIYPPTPVQAVFDAKTGASLEALLAQMNNIYVQYQGTPYDTRNIIPLQMRRAGLTITYMDMEGSTITERASNAVQKDNNHWGLDTNWSRIDELSLSGDIAVSANGTWIINGEDTGITARGPKGDTGLTPWLKTIDNKLHYSYDNETWEVCSESIAAWFRWSGNKIQISRDNKTWTDLSGVFADNVHIKGYVADYASLPTNAAQGDIYGVGPTYADTDTEQTNPIYRYYVKNESTWVDNGVFTSIAAGIVQETGDSESAVMSQKATTEKLSQLGSKHIYIKSLNGSTSYNDWVIGEYYITGGNLRKVTNAVDGVVYSSEIISFAKDVIYQNEGMIYIWDGEKLALTTYNADRKLELLSSTVAEDTKKINNPLKEMYIEAQDSGIYKLHIKRKSDSVLYIRVYNNEGEIVAASDISISLAKDVIQVDSYNLSSVVCYIVIDVDKLIVDDDNYYQYNPLYDIFNLSLNPRISEYLSITPIRKDVSTLYSNKTIFFADKELNAYFKEFYIEGLDENTEYCLRTFGWNSTSECYQINIGTESGNIIQIIIRQGYYGYASYGNIKAWVVIQNVEEINSYLIISNTDVAKTKLNKIAVSNLELSPYIKNIIDESSNNIVHVPISFNGYALPKNPSSLKILAVGNSFAAMPLGILPAWLNHLGIKEVTYGIVVKGGGSLQDHYNGLNQTYEAKFTVSKNVDGVQNIFGYVNPETKDENQEVYIKLSDALAFTDWDIITFQQNSGNSTDWNTIEPYLPKLIEAARYYCPNAGVKIGWQQTWAYANGYGSSTQDSMFNGIVECSKNVERVFGVDLIVPNGVVMQNLRSIPNSFWGDSLLSVKGNDTYSTSEPIADFCIDGLHPNTFAIYSLCATFVQLLINSCFNKTIRNCGLNYDIVRDDFAKVARQCVLKAIGNRFDLSEIDITSGLE